MIEKIALLFSTRPVRRRVTTARGTKERIDERACARLSEDFDLVIIGSAASSKVYARILQYVIPRNRGKMKMYDRSFFERFLGSATQLGDVQLTAGWKEILTQNNVIFELERKVSDENLVARTVSFNWRGLEDFVVDRRVAFIGSRADLFSPPGQA